MTAMVVGDGVRVCGGGRCEIASMDGADRDCATATAEKTDGMMGV